MYVKISVIVLCLGIAVGCSMNRPRESYSNLPKSKTINKVGILIRIPASSPVEYSRYSATLQAMIAGYKQVKEIMVIQEAETAVSVFKGNDERFYQISADGDFLHYKAAGVVHSYLIKNKDGMTEIFNTHTLDLLIIYELYGVVSHGMGFVDYDTVMVIVDRGLTVRYIDYGNDRLTINEFSNEVLWNFLLNEINARCVKTLMKLDFLD